MWNKCSIGSAKWTLANCKMKRTYIIKHRHKDTTFSSQDAWMSIFHNVPKIINPASRWKMDVTNNNIHHGLLTSKQILTLDCNTVLHTVGVECIWICVRGIVTKWTYHRNHRPTHRPNRVLYVTWMYVSNLLSCYVPMDMIQGTESCSLLAAKSKGFHRACTRSTYGYKVWG